MERQVGEASQRFADYCSERHVDEEEAVIAMTVVCHLDALKTIDRLGYSAGSINRQPAYCLQQARILSSGKGARTKVDWEKVEYYLGIGEKLRQ
jgi:hypothetical protein